MDYLSKIILTSRLEAFTFDLRAKLDEYKDKYPNADIKPLEAKLELMDETIELVHSLYERTAKAEYDNTQLLNYADNLRKSTK